MSTNHPKPPPPILSRPWAITEAGLQLVLGVWSRGDAFADVLARARAERGDKPLANDDGVYCVSDGVAMIPVVGPLVRHASMLTDVSGVTSYSGISRDLGAALADPEVKQILLVIDSPGGEATGCGELAARIRAASKVKPVTAYVEGDGCSAAYYLASAARKIIAAPCAELGSIGVRSAIIDSSGAEEKAGVRRIEIVSSQSPDKRGTPVDDEVIARLQTRMDDLAQVFIEDVARYRGVTPGAVTERLGRGGAMIASKAVAAGLADEIGTLDTLLAHLRATPTAPPGATRYEMSTTPAAPPTVPPAAPAAPQASSLEQYQPLLAQVAAMTGETEPAKQQAALAKLQGDKVALEGELRESHFALARARNVPPSAMLGWEHLPLAALKEVVQKAPAQAPALPSAPAAGSEPQTSASTVLTGWDRQHFAGFGITDEAEMIRLKAEAVRGLAPATARALQEMSR